MKFNWGVKIALVYAAFVVLVLAMAGFFMTRDVDLVSVKYYDEEIQYQKKIDDISRANKLPEQVSYNISGNMLVVQFPRAMDGGNIGGMLLLYRPSDFKKDRKVQLKLNSSNQMIVDLSGLEKGLWKLKTHWRFKEDKFFNEEIIHLY